MESAAWPPAAIKTTVIAVAKAAVEAPTTSHGRVMAGRQDGRGKRR
jgi:hypothetical protein